MIDLELDHAYSILDARQVGSQRLVRLRNPWGTKDKYGVSSENRINWSKNLPGKSAVSSDNDDGVFWMRMYLLFLCLLF